MSPKNALRWKRILSAICLSFAGGAAFADDKLLGMSAYDQVQQMRNEANRLIEKNTEPQALHKAIDIFDAVLAILDHPQTEELANGNIYLRFRRFDVELDIAQAFAMLGDKAAALDHLDAAERVASMDGEMAKSLIKFRPGLASLQPEPRFRKFMERALAIGRLWHHPDIATPYSSTLTVEQRIAGLSLFWSEANYNFVYFDHVPDLDWDKTYLEFLPQVMAAKNTHDYYEVLMRLAPLLHDGHTNIYPPEEIAQQFYARPPLRTELIEGRVLVRAVRSPTLEKLGVHAGDEIVAIDGDPVREYAQQHVRPFESSSTPQDADVRMYSYMLLAGDAVKPVVLTLRDARGHERTFSVGRGHYDDARSSTTSRFRNLGNGVVYLDVDQFEDDATVNAFEAALPEIYKAKALILDLRDNGGGSTNYGLQILGYLSKQPIPTTVARERDYRAAERARNPDATSLDWIRLDDSPYSHPRPRTFEGRVAVLIGPRTFSAGEDFVASFKLMRRGLLVGEPTGGSTGQPLMFKLPGGGHARICVKRDEFPDGTAFVGKGIAPDILVRPTVADVRAGRDPVLTYARAELLSGPKRETK